LKIFAKALLILKNCFIQTNFIERLENKIDSLLFIDCTSK
jgi:hypothetical protein